MNLLLDTQTGGFSNLLHRLDFTNFRNESTIVNVNTEGKDCVLMREDGKWEKDICDKTRPFICQKVAKYPLIFQNFGWFLNLPFYAFFGK